MHSRGQQHLDLPDGFRRPGVVGPDDLAEAWAAFLARWPWHWFATLTARTEMGAEAWDRSFAQWIGRIGRDLPRGRRPWAIRADEPHRSGRIHAHALIGFPEVRGRGGVSRPAAGMEPSRWAAACLWREWVGFARVETPKAVGGVVGYCSKYVSKGAGQYGDLASRPEGGTITLLGLGGTRGVRLSPWASPPA